MPCCMHIIATNYQHCVTSWSTWQFRPYCTTHQTPPAAPSKAAHSAHLRCLSGPAASTHRGGACSRHVDTYIASVSPALQHMHATRAAAAAERSQAWQPRQLQAGLPPLEQGWPQCRG